MTSEGDLRHHWPVVGEGRHHTWLVYCDACSAETGQYVYPCKAGRIFPPRILQDPKETLLAAARELIAARVHAVSTGLDDLGAIDDPVDWLRRRAKELP